MARISHIGEAIRRARKVNAPGDQRGPPIAGAARRAASKMKSARQRKGVAQTAAVFLLVFAPACSQRTAPHETVFSAETSTLPPTVSEEINRSAGAWIGSGKALGVVVEASRSGRLIFARGYGRPTLDSKQSVTTRTQFRIGSLTKQFTAAAILRLVGDGKVSLEDRLSRYFPDFPRAGEVTIRQLLTHTSGIHNYTEFGFNIWDFYQFTQSHTTLDWVNHIAHQKPLYDFPPGSAWHYDNSGFFLLGAIVEKVSRKTLDRYLQESFFRPLSMDDTAFDGDSDVGPGRAEGYEHAGPHAGAFKRALAISMTVPGGAGSLRSSTRDLINWTNVLFQGRVVDPALVTAMMTPARLNDGRLSSANRINMDPAESYGEYGFGLRIGQFLGRREIGHEGDIFGFNAAMDTYPEDDQLTVVVLANTPAGAFGLEKQIATIILNSGLSHAPRRGAKAGADPARTTGALRLEGPGALSKRPGGEI
jgi:CubicO group peptidase (beta-lactamase class C family)